MLEVLYKDKQIAVVVKPVGLISEDGAVGESICPLLRETLGVSEVYAVHRLDRAVGGVMVYALTKKAAAELSNKATTSGPNSLACASNISIFWPATSPLILYPFLRATSSACVPIEPVEPRIEIIFDIIIFFNNIKISSSYENYT